MFQNKKVVLYGSPTRVIQSNVVTVVLLPEKGQIFQTITLEITPVEGKWQNRTGSWEIKPTTIFLDHNVLISPNIIPEHLRSKNTQTTATLVPDVERNIVVSDGIQKDRLVEKEIKMCADFSGERVKFTADTPVYGWYKIMGKCVM